MLIVFVNNDAKIGHLPKKQKRLHLPWFKQAPHKIT
jgi:hypothetical protein